jgi:cytochrome c-type biogenesis protein CcsB
VLDVLFLCALIVYGIAAVLHLVGLALKHKSLASAVWVVFLVAFTLHTAYFVGRGIVAGRLPLSNQFEFAMSFSWGISLLYIALRMKWSADWMTTFALPVAFLLLLYAAILPREIRELMPALRSRWFGLHIGAAVLSYASFTLSGCAGVRYLVALKKGEPEDSSRLRQIDFFAYRLVVLGLLMLTVVVLSGAVWAEQAWSRFWSWDPKELWSLVTWIVYAIYLHQRLRMKWQGKRMAVFAIFAVGIVLFTFIGVNTLLPGLHSYAS